MKPIKITWKSTYAGYVIDSYKGGTEYRVLFRDVPYYIEKEWREFADGICPDGEEPGLEIQLVLMPNGDMHNIEVKYYFDDYEYFELKPDDEEKALEEFKKFVKENDNGLPDAYNPKTDELVGELEWEQLAYEY